MVNNGGATTSVVSTRSNGRSRPSPLFDLVRQRVEDYVVSVGLRPGDRLPGERALAAELGVSRNSLREALASLAEAGVVTVVHGSGAYLTQVEPRLAARQLATALVRLNRDLPEAVLVRSALESLAARLAAENRTEAHLARLERAIHGMATELASGRSGQKQSLSFHHGIWAASGNRVLRDTLVGLQPELDRLRHESLAQPDSVAKAIVAHRKVFELVRDGTADEAAIAMADHIHDVADAPLVRPGHTRADDTHHEPSEDPTKEDPA